MLVLAPVAAGSHFIHLESYVRALLARNHEVTFVTNFPLEGPKPENYTEIRIESPYPVDNSFGK